MKKTVTALVIVSTFLGVVGCNRRGYSNDPDKLTSYVSSKLKLSDNQKTSLKSLAVELKKSKEKIASERATLKQELTKLMASDSLDEAKTKELFRKVSASVSGEADKLIKPLADFQSTLSAEQKKSLVNLLDEHWNE